MTYRWGSHRKGPCTRRCFTQMHFTWMWQACRSHFPWPNKSLKKRVGVTVTRFTLVFPKQSGRFGRPQRVSAERYSVSGLCVVIMRLVPETLPLLRHKKRWSPDDLRTRRLTCVGCSKPPFSAF